ncbi:hypothetical protein MCHI_003240 [Candidatus Magnetoovum chiemensis]|nr:hypothetical protein MCHI_003240 [Candidatus Magnetoovum chiemensis]
MALSIIFYLVAVAFNSGKVKGQYEESAPISKWGKVNVYLLLLWILAVVSLGVVFTIKNYA